MSKIKVLFVASEIAPYAKTGGLADVSSALPIALKEKGKKKVLMLYLLCLYTLKLIEKNINLKK